MPDLDTPPCPPELAHVWAGFCEVFCGAVLTFAELEAWGRLTFRNLTVFELRLVRQLSILALQ